MSKEKNNFGMRNLIKALNEEKEESKIISILEERGRSCIPSTLLKRAKDATRNAKSTDEFLERLASVVPYLKREKGGIYMVYPRCFCHRTKKYDGKIPAKYCNCSVGWVKELFQHTLERPVTVVLESSVLRGDKECRLKVSL